MPVSVTFPPEIIGSSPGRDAERPALRTSKTQAGRPDGAIAQIHAVASTAMHVPNRPMPGARRQLPDSMTVVVGAGVEAVTGAAVGRGVGAMVSAEAPDTTTEEMTVPE